MRTDADLRAYRLRILLDHLASTPTEAVRLVDATAVLVDVRRSAHLSERLAGDVRERAERLAGTIGACFGALRAVAYEEGGSLLKSSADALLLPFDGDALAERGCRQAAAMWTALGGVPGLEEAGRAAAREALDAGAAIPLV